MGIFDFISKKRKSEQHNLIKISEHLKGSFNNVKKDILHLHGIVEEHTKSTNNKFLVIEDRMKRIERLLATKQNQEEKESSSTHINKIQLNYKELEEEILVEPETSTPPILNVLRSLPRAELKLFKALYELQNSLNAKHISYKSLANYLYPGKEYNSIRSTITQFVLRLYTEGLIDKQRIGKE